MHFSYLSIWRVLNRKVIFLNFCFTQITIAVAWLPRDMSRFQAGRTGGHYYDLVRGEVVRGPVEMEEDKGMRGM